MRQLISDTINYSWIIMILAIIVLIILFAQVGDNVSFAFSLFLLALLVLICCFPIVYSLALRKGQGELAPVVATQIIFLFFWYLFLIICASEENSKTKRFRILSTAALALFYLYCAYPRLEKKTPIGFIDEIKKGCSDFNSLTDRIPEIFFTIVCNEWFKGIAIAASGAVLGGVILNKITNRGDTHAKKDRLKPSNTKDEAKD